ncbi:hypothetical protein Bca52824_092870 [Brassica carinata]|uniref:Uncharacterized protein n=1 Tax=Brassica carinata TaxID=52824 RepID=A0A8X7P647_BRACI|nr:hypothetical protein Bca52824_092870 [Brassica carinata]
MEKSMFLEEVAMGMTLEMVATSRSHWKLCFFTYPLPVKQLTRSLQNTSPSRGHFLAGFPTQNYYL